MQIAPGSWILDAMKSAPARSRTVPQVERATPPKPEQRVWMPPSAEGRGLLIDLVV